MIYIFCHNMLTYIRFGSHTGPINRTDCAWVLDSYNLRENETVIFTIIINKDSRSLLVSTTIGITQGAPPQVKMKYDLFLLKLHPHLQKKYYYYSYIGSYLKAVRAKAEIWNSILFFFYSGS